MLFLCLVPLSVAAQDPLVIHCDLESCIETALLSHPDLQAAEAGRRAAETRIGLEKAQWRPQLNFKGESGFIRGRAVSSFAVTRDITEEGILQQDRSGLYYQGSLIFDIPIMKEGNIFGWKSPSMQQARLGLTAKVMLELMRRKQIVYSVTKAYIDGLKASGMLKSQEQFVKLIEDDYNTIRVKFIENLVSRNDLIIAKVQLAIARRDLTVFQNSLNQAKWELARAMGLDATAEVEILNGEPLPSVTASLPSIQELVPFAFQHRQEFEEQILQIQVKECVIPLCRIFGFAYMA